jgi:hypothetical protein
VTVADGNRAGHIAVDDHANQPRAADMSWALDEFYAAVEEEFGVPVGDDGYLETPGAVIDFIVENTRPSDGLTGDEYRDHVAGVVGEIMARTLGVTRYREDSHFVEDLHIR